MGFISLSNGNLATIFDKINPIPLKVNATPDGIPNINCHLLVVYMSFVDSIFKPGSLVWSWLYGQWVEIMF